MTELNYRTPEETLEKIKIGDEICDRYQTFGKVREIEKVTRRNSVFYNYTLENGQKIAMLR